MTEKIINPEGIEASKESPLDQETSLVDRLQHVVGTFQIPDYVTELEPQFDPGGPIRLGILFTQDIINLEGQQRDDLYKQLRAVLAKNNLELGTLVSAGGQSESYLIYEPQTDGKTNWRRWVNHPRSISRSTQDILDRVGEIVGQQEGLDSFEKFSNYYEEAFKRGLISEKEKRLIEGEKYHASWG